jgi:hypothetical protein
MDQATGLFWFQNVVSFVTQDLFSLLVYTKELLLEFLYHPFYPNKSCPCALTEHHIMEAYWGSGGIAPLILDLGIRWR